jgi:CRISPR-associated protein Cas2
MVVVVYDIPDDKRRLKLATLLEGYGYRVQHSVFECFIKRDEMVRLHQRVSRLVDASADNVRFYWLTPQAMSQTLTVGSLPPEPPPTVYIV